MRRGGCARCGCGTCGSAKRLSDDLRVALRRGVGFLRPESAIWRSDLRLRRDVVNSVRSQRTHALAVERTLSQLTPAPSIHSRDPLPLTTIPPRTCTTTASHGDRHSSALPDVRAAPPPRTTAAARTHRARAACAARAHAAEPPVLALASTALAAAARLNRTHHLHSTTAAAPRCSSLPTLGKLPHRNHHIRHYASHPGRPADQPDCALLESHSG